MADNVYNLKFTLSNGDVIDAGQITAPQGPKGDKGDSADIPYSSSTPFMDGVGSVGSANTVARGDHRHPSDTSRQEKLVSGTNIKTINGQSVLGSGDIQISGGGTIDADTLNGLLLGSNGIEVAKNAAGDKVEVKLDDNIKLGSPQAPIEGRTASLGIVTFPTGGRPYYIRLNNNGIQFQSGNSDLLSLTASAIQLVDIGGGGISKEFLHQGNVKTLFGNQSIYGSGNIDLYRHNIHIAGETADSEVWCNMIIISSKNMVVDSLTDLYTLCNGMGDLLPISGLCKISSVEGKGVAILCRATASGGIYWIGSDNASRIYTWSSMPTLTITDTVTTV